MKVGQILKSSTAKAVESHSQKKSAKIQRRDTEYCVPIALKSSLFTKESPLIHWVGTRNAPCQVFSYTNIGDCGSKTLNRLQDTNRGLSSYEALFCPERKDERWIISGWNLLFDQEGTDHYWKKEKALQFTGVQTQRQLLSWQHLHRSS